MKHVLFCLPDDVDLGNLDWTDEAAAARTAKTQNKPAPKKCRTYWVRRELRMAAHPAALSPEAYKMWAEQGLKQIAANTRAKTKLAIAEATGALSQAVSR
jgi:hypothetical protein